MCDYEPICEFENQQELDNVLHWWQEKLFLQDWIISAKIVSHNEFDLEDSCGENILTFESKTAVIHLLDMNLYPKDSPVKYCQEKVLVHELLHCKYNFIQSTDSYSERYLDCIEHQRLEEMAKTLIMAKYDIPLDWFINDQVSTSD